MKLSEPITDVEQLTPALLTDRFSRNGFLKSGSVTSIKKRTHSDHRARNGTGYR